ncbi:hypothetical protein SAMD00019534_058990, partial [Acytostelium subglobosum LB1]|uniref:hypothetical protein n=1 Tax=Acytostelium subglobosum LB1 TaxID=1410327 RepID=UPI000644F0CD
MIYSHTCDPIIMEDHHQHHNNAGQQQQQQDTTLLSPRGQQQLLQSKKRLVIDLNGINPLQSTLTTTITELGCGGDDLSRANNNNNNMMMMDENGLKRYETVCTQVTDYLFMGGERVAANLDQLRSHGITHVLNASLQCDNFFEHHPMQPFIYRKFPLRDTAEEDIGAIFPGVIEFIEMARRANGKVFVHCQMGVSRSPCLCTVWTMYSNRCSLREASDYIKSIRPISLPNVGFQLSLKRWAEREGLLHNPSKQSLPPPDQQHQSQ